MKKRERRTGDLRVFPGLLALSGIFALSGCGKKPPVKTSAQKKAAPKDAAVPGSIRGEGWRITWRSRTGKNPNRLAPPVLTGVAKRGEIGGDEENPALKLQEFRAKLYSDGKPAADLLAPEVTADEEGREVLATGGVTVIALKTGTKTTADRMTWNMETGKIVGEGHVFSLRRASGKTPQISQTGNKFTYSPDREEFEIE